MVRPILQHNAAARIDERLVAAAGIQDPHQARELVGTLEKLARRLAGTLSPELFDWYTAETPPWDTSRPQPAMRHLAGAGALRGRVLGFGCGTGTGEHPTTDHDD
ncbi:hypothetical protein [Micromonospora sp. NPDC001898]|uniref:hypothetical protein n=1 Tax=Micromonospora sp. NPDC001898 TaxID=3364221 RepID=UPI0036B93F98